MTLTNAMRRAKGYGFVVGLRRKAWDCGHGLTVDPSAPEALYAFTAEDATAGDWQVVEASECHSGSSRG